MDKAKTRKRDVLEFVCPSCETVHLIDLEEGEAIHSFYEEDREKAEKLAQEKKDKLDEKENGESDSRKGSETFEKEEEEEEEAEEHKKDEAETEKFDWEDW